MRGDTSASRESTTQPADGPGPVAGFVSRWHSSGSAERAKYQLFLSELCDLLSVPRPDPSRPGDRDNAYVFERMVHFDHGDGTSSTGRIDLYKRGCFVLEAKQGSAAAEGPALFDAAALGEGAGRKRKGTAVRGSHNWDAAMTKQTTGSMSLYLWAGFTYESHPVWGAPAIPPPPGAPFGSIRVGLSPAKSCTACSRRHLP